MYIQTKTSSSTWYGTRHHKIHNEFPIRLPSRRDASHLSLAQGGHAMPEENGNGGVLGGLCGLAGRGMKKTGEVVGSGAKAVGDTASNVTKPMTTAVIDGAKVVGDGVK